MKAKDIRSMTLEEIQNKINEMKDKLFKQKIQKAIGQADNPYTVSNTRHEIARLHTILTEKRLKNEQK